MDKEIAEAKRRQAEGEKTQTAAQVGSVAGEVASRTGLFGQIGGIFGHIAGSVAAQTAASATQQSGRQSAAAAAEREKQALARKEHLTTMFLGKGCDAANLDAPPKNPGGVQVAMASAAAASSAPPASPEEIVRRAVDARTPVSAEIDFDRNQVQLGAAKRVIVPGFRVAYVVRTRASAYAGGGLANIGQGIGTNRTITQSQNRRVEMALAGADAALLQALTDRLYADFVARLRASGKEVVDVAALRNTEGFGKLQPVEKLPYAVSPSMQGDSRDYLVFTPRELPLAFMHIDSYLGNAGPFQQDSTKAVHELAARLDAVAFIPTIHVDIAEVESSGRSSLRAGAHADLLPRLGLGARSELRMVTGKDARIFYTGDMGHLVVKRPWFTEGEAGTMRIVDAFDTAGLANSMTMATGLQGAQHFSEKRELRVEPQRFASAVLAVGDAFSGAAMAALK